MSVPDQIRQLRKETLKLSQEAFAKKLNTHRVYISGIERGVMRPSVGFLQKVAATFNTTIIID